MKIVINQNKNGIFTVGSNQFINIAKLDTDGNVTYSIGIENISFAIYNTEKEALTVFNEVIGFLRDDTINVYQFL